MFEVFVNDKYIYYPANASFAIFNAVVKQDVGLAGEFEFTVPQGNPNYSLLEQGAVVTINRNGAEFWRGEVKSVTYDFDKNAKVYALEDLAWLGDEATTPTYMDTESYTMRFQAAITLYNSNRSSDREFTAGYISNVTATDTCVWATTYEDTLLDAIRNCIAKDSGYLKVRRVTAGGTVTRYIDCVPLSGYGSQSTQPIQFGYNLLEYAQEFDLSSLVNVLSPFGDETDTEIYEGVNQRIAGTPISNATSISTYGRHAKNVIFDGVTEVNSLNNLAAAYLGRWSQPQITLQVSAIDLAEVDGLDSIDIGDSVRIIAEPFSIDQWLYVTDLTIDLQNPDQNKITLSGAVRTGRTLTSQTADTADIVKNMPSKSSILEAAKKNALEILNGTDGGYVTFETNAQDQITELRIANNIDYTQATKCWRWNLGGLAYLERASDSDPWTVTTAATMDGGFVADFITSGSLTLGNGGTDNPLLQAYAGNTLVTRINRDGLYAIAGTVGGFTLDATKMTRGDAQMTQYVMGCGYAGRGIVNLVGNKTGSDSKYGYIQISNSGNPDQCVDGIRIYGNGLVERYNSSGNLVWDKYLSNIPNS